MRWDFFLATLIDLVKDVDNKIMVCIYTVVPLRTPNTLHIDPIVHPPPSNQTPRQFCLYEAKNVIESLYSFLLGGFIA